MPPRVSAPSLRALRQSTTARSFCCAQCHSHRTVARASLKRRIKDFEAIRNGRWASTVSATPSADASRSPSVTPITTFNSPLDVPPESKELYQALENLKTDAANYVGVSRLGLALRSLEGKDGIVRIAVLAMDGHVGKVRRLVRLLLADPLGKEQAWERELIDGSGGESVLIKSGDGRDAIQSSSSVHTVHIPSATLQKHRLELLVSSIQLETAPSEFGPADRAHDAILVSSFNAPATSNGKYSHLTYPVHKTLLVGQGMKSLVDYGRFIRGQELPSDMVQIAIQMPNIPSPASNEPGDATILDVETGEHALASIRQSIDNALAWEHGWFRAGIPPLSAWLTEGCTATDNGLRPVVQRLVNSVLKDCDVAVASSALTAETEARSATVPDAVRQRILEATVAWSEAAHTELRNEIDLAFASKNWARLKWYKLFWRSDDVTMLLSEIMERKWLVEAEKESIYLAGRIEGAGLVGEEAQGKLLKSPPTMSETAPGSNGSSIQASEVVLASSQHPYPMHIPLTRLALSSRTIPSLQALSQKLVLETGTATAVTTALTAMAYIGFANATLFEAGAVFAFGVVISLKRLQNKWEAAREYWQGEVREEGRLALKETEDGIKEIVRIGGVSVIDEAGVEDRRRAKQALDTAREALNSLR